MTKSAQRHGPAIAAGLDGGGRSRWAGWGWRLSVVGVVLLVSWPVVTRNLGQYFLLDGDADPEVRAHKTLAWAPEQPEALYILAAREASKDPQTAARRLSTVLWKNPAHGRAAVLLAALMQQTEADRADQLAELAAQIEPADAAVQQQLASYWFERGQMERAVAHWSAALTADPSRRKALFKTFLEIAKAPAVRAALRVVVADPPPWWEDFFSYVARNTADVEPLQALYDMRRTEGPPLSDKERRIFIERLMQDGYWQAAYVAWLSGLDGAARRGLGLLFNGGFESPLSNMGFGWHVRPVKGVTVRREHTYGVGGEKALHLVFQDERLVFHHLEQPLRLDPGTHRLRGRVRIDSLLGRGGLRWELRCRNTERTLLGASDRFVGTSEWHAFTIDFEVPVVGCSGQVLRLVSTGKRVYDHKLKGGIWFDDLSIRRELP